MGQLRDHANEFITTQLIGKYLGEVNGPKGIKKLQKHIDEADEKSAAKTAYVLLRCLLHARQRTLSTQPLLTNSVGATTVCSSFWDRHS